MSVVAVPLQFEVLTLFPQAVKAFTESGILGRAIADGRVHVHCTDYRIFSNDKHRRVDDAPFGGGAGMTIRAAPVVEALEHVERQRGSTHRILLTPAAPRFDQQVAKRLAALDRIALLCGRYEGVDDRVREHFVDECLSIGDYVLNGGEVAAAAIIEAVSRLRTGVLGNQESLEQESFSGAWLEYPQYTRPATFRGIDVPRVLLAGDHADVEHWRVAAAVRRTIELRPDLVMPADDRRLAVFLVIAGDVDRSDNTGDEWTCFDGAWTYVAGRPRMRFLGGAPTFGDGRASPAGGVGNSSSGSPTRQGPHVGQASAPRDLRDLRRMIRTVGLGEPRWIQVVSPSDADVATAVSVEMCRAQLVAHDAGEQARAWVFVVESASSSVRPPGGFHARLSLPIAAVRSGLAPRSRIEHPSHPAAQDTAISIAQQLGHEIGKYRRALADGRDP